MRDLAPALSAYQDYPMDNGGMAVFLDAGIVVEIEGGADDWGADLTQHLAASLAQVGSDAQLAIARPGAELLGSDHALWADLREELLGSPVQLLPLLALPAA